MSSNIIHLKAAGGVLYKAGSSPKKVLLIKRNGFWDLPKGKLEEGESLEECAVREVEEETGAKNLSIENYLCDTWHDYQMNDQKYEKTTYWYSMPFGLHDFEFVPQIEEGITKVEWVEFEKAKTLVEFENLVKVLDVFDKQ